MRNVHWLWVLPLWAALSACVTLPGAPNANASGSGDSVQTSISSGVSALTDFFSPEVREFKKLVTEGKMDEALAYVKEKDAFFAARYQANAAAPAEFVALARHVLEAQYRPQIVQTKAALTALGELTQLPARTQADVAWDNGKTLSLEMGEHVLNKITTVWRDDIEVLDLAQANFKELAQAQKPAFAASMFNEVLASAKDRYPYVGDLSLIPSDFADSPAFQSAALSRFKSASGRREFESLAGRMSNYLSADSRAALDDQFVEMVRKDFMADGRISLEELGQLGEMNTPIARSKTPFKGMVKVGLASLVRKSGTREFYVGVQEDLAFDLGAAADAMLKERNGSAFDFIYLLSVIDARVSRETGAPQIESSRYRAGTDREINPAHEPARQRLARAEADLRREQNKDTSCPRGMSVNACAIQQIGMVANVSFASKEVNAAKALLEKTPQMLEKPRVTSYQYRVIPQTVRKEVSGVAVLWDVKGRQAWVLPAEHSAQRTFRVPQDVHQADENRDAILNRADKPQDADRFAKEAIELSLNSLFAPGRLAAARKAAAGDAGAVMDLLNQEYEAKEPKDDPPTVGRVFK